MVQLWLENWIDYHITPERFLETTLMSSTGDPRAHNSDCYDAKPSWSFCRSLPNGQCCPRKEFAACNRVQRPDNPPICRVRSYCWRRSRCGHKSQCLCNKSFILFVSLSIFVPDLVKASRRQMNTRGRHVCHVERALRRP